MFASLFLFRFAFHRHTQVSLNSYKSQNSVSMFQKTVKKAQEMGFWCEMPIYKVYEQRK